MFLIYLPKRAIRAVIRPFCGCTMTGNRKPWIQREDLWCDCNTKHSSSKQPGQKNSQIFLLPVATFGVCFSEHFTCGKSVSGRYGTTKNIQVRRRKKNHLFIVITMVFLTPATKQWHRPPKHPCYRQTNQIKTWFSLAHKHTQNASSDCIKLHGQFCRRIILSSCSCLVIIFVHLL